MQAYVYTPQLIDLLSGCLCAFIFILFVFFDAWKALSRRAFWFPGRALILGALSVQLINYLDYSIVNLNTGNDVSTTYTDLEAVLKIQLLTDGGRVVICVFIAYLLPGMVSSRFRDVWTDIGALALSVLAHVLNEFYFVSFLEKHGSYSTKSKWFKLFSCILITSLILLLVLSICAVFAAKSIRSIINQKVPSVLSCCDPNVRPLGCKNIEEHVLKCWIVVRSYQPDYIMARSVFSSLAGLVLTVCVVSIIVKWGYLHHDDFNQLNGVKKTTFILQILFVLLGWIVVFLRWLTSVILLPRDEWRSIFPRDGGCSIFPIEDFWTRSMIELKERLDGHSIGRMLPEKINSKRRQLHHLLLAIGVFLQKLMVLLSKASWFLSRWIFLPLLVIISRMINLWSYSPGSEITNCINVLEIIRMPGEMASSLWIANVLAFKQTKEHLEEGRTKTSTTNLRRVMERSTTNLWRVMERRLYWSAADEARETQLGETSLVAKWSWKMRAVSLIHFMLCLYDTNNSQIVNDAIEACSQAWDLMDFVDNSDPEADLVGRIVA